MLTLPQRKGREKMNLPRIVLGLSAILTAFAICLFAQQKGQIKITCTVLKRDGSPAAGVFLDIYRLKSPGWQIDLDGEGTVTNPSGKSDSKGQLTILLPQDYLKPGDEFTLGRLAPQLELKDEKGTPVTFKYPDKIEAKTVNLGKITLHE
jgi:hypothetical protein